MKILIKIVAGILAGLVLLIGAFVFMTWAPDRPVSELKARWAPAPSVFVEVSEMSVHLRDEGPRSDPVPIILLHGTSSSLHTWEGWVQELKTKRRVITVDMPGFGLTGPSPDNVYTHESYARFIIAVMDKLGLQRSVLGGNSFGGNVSWVTALMYPGRVEKLILVDSSGYDRRHTSMPIGFRIAQIPVLNRLMAHVLPRSMIQSSIQNVYGDPGRVTPELVDRYFDMTVREGNRRALVERFKQAPSGGPMASRISELKIPTLILWGGRDRLILPVEADHFHHDIEGSQLAMFNDLGHVPQEEDPAGTVAAVKQFLDIH
jgi:pimeloyl-ACP methyl ester carboxylesterase